MRGTPSSPLRLRLRERSDTYRLPSSRGPRYGRVSRKNSSTGCSIEGSRAGSVGTTPASGGASGGGTYGARGGNGGTDVAPTAGDDNDGDGNGGGGGGAAGRIVIRTRNAQLLGTSSPTAAVAPY